MHIISRYVLGIMLIFPFITFTEPPFSLSLDSNTTLSLEVKGLEPVPDACNAIAKAVTTFSSYMLITTHALGIMALGLGCLWWCKNRYENNTTSTTKKDKIANALLFTGGLLFTLGAPLIAAKTHQFTTILL